MKLFIHYLKHKLHTIAALIFFAVLFFCSFMLYHLPPKAVMYPSALCTVFAILFLLFDYLKFRKIAKELEKTKALTALTLDEYPDIYSPTDRYYVDIINALCEKAQKASEKEFRRYSDMIDYYTVWAHQIKTPIASQRLILQSEDSEIARKSLYELNRIEGYVNMVLTFLRLDSDSTDYVIKNCELDKIVRESIRKFSGEFILKHLSLSYTPSEFIVLTDEKWLSFVIEQLISNAVKYTDKGEIAIYEKDGVLYIEDTGIGISKTDLPRIFENGYTGFNGHYDKRSTGIGLYLCKRICDNLNHKISVSSKEGEGSIFALHLKTTKRIIE